ncbi:MAG: hypothetical protein K0R08_1985 [Solimicrobium sp.]|nr:hypothetical protein [Solimicrobium sp.]
MAACNTEHIGNCEAGMVFTPLAGAVASLFAGLYFSASERPDKLALGGFFLSAPGFFIAAMLLTQCSSENSVYCGVGSTLSPFMGMLAFTSLAVAMSDRMSGS